MELEVLVALVGAEINRMVDASGKSKAALCRHMGVARSWLPHRVYRGDMNPTLTTIWRIADACGFDVRISFERRAEKEDDDLEWLNAPLTEEEHAAFQEAAKLAENAPATYIDTNDSPPQERCSDCHDSVSDCPGACGK